MCTTVTAFAAHAPEVTYTKPYLLTPNPGSEMNICRLTKDSGEGSIELGETESFGITVKAQKYKITASIDNSLKICYNRIQRSRWFIKNDVYDNCVFYKKGAAKKMTSLLIIIFICFIGVGLPDSVLGSAWPVIYKELSLPISLAGYISATVSACTIVSSLISAKVIKRFGTGGVTAISTIMTTLALFGFAFTKNPVFFFVMAIPLGLGAGSIDTALNNFVALHYSASKMNFLHCFYGLGVAFSPYLMSAALSADNNWRKGYVLVAVIQSVISVVAVTALPLWKKAEKKATKPTAAKAKF